ncbi:threonine transporter [Phyllobacterium brassicacearum]|uniref:Threonine transporter n=1 Tax=Phyllobacterium brassicacearum TaxID=314235 RepID=A0A2P7BEP5_9HYPH|nr:LysE family transporter [Phyllobacterium brassicacearum]PSH64885.1 threonine transporter [Phyllobacterium brassicacearum]TDQ22964.1 threonine/homoserine/homoserine lactone efflux protein [Phyllobacterium brassicacearum]
MTAFAVLLSILAAISIGAISPGPSFVLVSRIAVASSRTHGLASALGMGVGGALFAALAVLGLTALLMQFEWLYLLLKLLGGAYLVYIAIRIWRGASEPLALSGSIETASGISVSRAFLLGLITQLSNPKTSIVYASIFAALMPPSPPLWLLLALPPMLFCVEAGWYAVVAFAFSGSRARLIYGRLKLWIDRGAGAVMGALGLKLMVEAFKTRA